VTLTLSQGVVTFREDDAKTPCTAESFRFLAGKGFFDHTICHRLTTKGIFVLQCGDPTGTGSGGPGYTIPDENLTGATYPAGTVAMANTGSPHTGGSQFFLVYASSALPPQYTPFGTVTTGLPVLQAIAKAGEDDSNGPGDGKPKQPVTITSFLVAPDA
jgi:peptidyl-prolyl cis-trans isomerase B (cyclophilin B)